MELNQVFQTRVYIQMSVGPFRVITFQYFMVYPYCIAVAHTGLRILKMNLSSFMSKLSKEQNIYSLNLGFGNIHRLFKPLSTNNLYSQKAELAIILSPR